jgi:hypothetical protein
MNSPLTLRFPTRKWVKRAAPLPTAGGIADGIGAAPLIGGGGGNGDDDNGGWLPGN